MRFRNWCWTLFKDDITESTRLELDASAPRHRYSVWQMERCPESGRLHFQGYTEFNSPVRMGGVKQFLGEPSAHLEKRRGSRTEARDYCRKAASRVSGPWELGDSNDAQGRRNDLDSLAESIVSGEVATISEVRRSVPGLYVKYRRGLEALVFATGKEQSRGFRNLEVLVYYGEAGSGKTRKAVEQSGDDYFILDGGSSGGSLWFDGYEGEKTIIIDDFYGWIKYQFLLRMLDGYSLRLPIKGGFVYAAYTHVYVTSNEHPQAWYERGVTPALRRRISKVFHFQIDSTTEINEY